MRPRRIVALAVLLVAVPAVLAACGSTGGAPPHAPASGDPTPVVTTSPGPAGSDAAAIFIAALGGPIRPADRPDSGKTYIVDHTVCSAALHQPPCPPRPIPDDVQAEVVAALGPQVRFVAEPPTELEPAHSVVITLGPARIDGDRATVTVESECGPLCGQGETVVLHKRGDRWVRTGTEGWSWIS